MMVGVGMMVGGVGGVGSVVLCVVEVVVVVAGSGGPSTRERKNKNANIKPSELVIKTTAVFASSNKLSGTLAHPTNKITRKAK